MAFRPVADQHEFGWNALIDFLEDMDYIFHPLHFSEIGDVNQNAFAVGGDSFFEMIFVDFPKAFKVDEVVDDADIVVDVEVIVGLLLQTF